MPFFIGVPIGITGFLGCDTAGNNCDSATRFNPADKLVAVVAFIRKNELALQIEWFQQVLRNADVVAVAAGQDEMQRVPKAIGDRMNFCGQSPAASSGFFVVLPLFTPLAC